MTRSDTSEFKDAMRAFVGNCSIITVGKGAERSGLVVTSAVALSVDPPTLLVCINRDSSSWSLLRKHRCFGCSSLGANHQKVAERFAGFRGVKGEDRYADAEWEATETGVSVLVDAPAVFDCEVEDIIDRGTHSIVLGRVRAIHQTPNTGALIYWHGGFKSLQNGTES